MRLLADRMVELGYANALSYETVRRTLKKSKLKPHLKRQWVIPPRKSAAFVWRMEEVLDLYEQPYDPRSPMICFDEHPCQMLGEVRDPLPMVPGKVRRFDSEYRTRRHGLRTRGFRAFKRLARGGGERTPSWAGVR